MIPTATADKGAPFPPHFLWTREKYEQATTLGLLGPEDHVELIEGEIVQKMPQNNPHQSAIGAMQEALGGTFPSGHWVRIQMPLALGGRSMPEPDLAVVVGGWRDYRQGAPTGETTRLVVEVADSTLPSDRATKASLYARSGIQEYWIVNLNDRILEVHRSPGLVADALLGYGYLEVRHLGASETISPLAAPGVTFAVSDLLP